MIHINQEATRRIELSWETGEDYRFIQELEKLIRLRNYDKRVIEKLKEKNK